MIDGLFKSQKEAKRNRRKETTGSQFVMDGVTVPTWSDEIDDEKSHDGNTMVEWAFMQDSSLAEYHLDYSAKELVHNLKDDKDHIYNQTGSLSNADDRMWRLLLDSQSTCNVIINGNLLSNARECEWTLKLQTQAGECCIDQIGEMKGVGAVWYYLQGVANILSQFMMAKCSK